jgi:hypothetical protein
LETTQIWQLWAITAVIVVGATLLGSAVASGMLPMDVAVPGKAVPASLPLRVIHHDPPPPLEPPPLSPPPLKLESLELDPELPKLPELQRLRTRRRRVVRLRR